MDWFSFISGMVYGALILLWLLNKKFKIERKHPYKYTCPEEGCFFGCSSNVDYMTVMKMADAHAQYHRKEV